MHTENFLNKQNNETIKIINDPTSTITEVMYSINKYTDFNNFLIKNKNNSIKQNKDTNAEENKVEENKVEEIKEEHKKKINIVILKTTKENDIIKEDKDVANNSNLIKENEIIKENNGKDIRECDNDFKSLLKKILIKHQMNYERFFIIMEEIEKLKGEYHSVYCNEYKLFMILQLEDSLNKWSSLTTSIFYSPMNKKSKHYENLRSQYERWCKKEVFLKAYKKIKPFNYNSIETTFEYEDDIYVIDVNKDFFIDSTNVFNQRGSEQIIINPELKKKKITKISEICDVDGFVVSVCFNNPLDKVINYNHVKKNIKTAKNDSNCVKETIDNINENIKTNDIVLIGDKGYKIKNYKNNNVKIITPNKKNQKRKLINRHDNNKLKYRHIVENSINGWKCKGRISLRKDKKITTFSGWVYLSVLQHNLKTNKRKEEIYLINNTEQLID